MPGFKRECLTAAAVALLLGLIGGAFARPLLLPEEAPVIIWTGPVREELLKTENGRRYIYLPTRRSPGGEWLPLAPRELQPLGRGRSVPDADAN